MNKPIEQIIPCSTKVFAGYSIDDEVQTCFDIIQMWGIVKEKTTSIVGFIVSEHCVENAEDSSNFSGYYSSEDIFAWEMMNCKESNVHSLL